ncbi:ABC transporter permease [Pilimelia anulata]|uniref:ABC transporter permease n=1 Tax=Pilimelia anulata TaxID=53371 RepID=A0A8J3B7R2_9ACTN|nr:ABC transporter permease [Pilimelia anulata]GGJ79850.1 ABC transporter permease [Pilimelia anulata]
MSSTVLDPPLVPAAAPPAAARPPGAARRLGRRLIGLRKLTGLVAVLLAWQWGTAHGDAWGAMTPSPAEVGAAAAELLRSGELADHLAVSLGRVGAGLAIGLGAGLLLGLGAGLLRLVEDVVDAPLQALRMLPHLALLPLFIIWFGIGEQSKVTLIAVGAVFPLYLNVLHGIRGVDERLVESARSCGVRGPALVRRVILPGALPQILIGLRQALGVGWLGLVVAELVNAEAGIGFLLNDAKEFLRTDKIFVVLVLYALFGVATDQLVRFVERRALAWRRGFAGE